MASFMDSIANAGRIRHQAVIRLGILGSTQCHHPQTAEFCRHLGLHLRRFDLTLVTGGLTGAPRIVADVFDAADQTCNRVIHLLPYFTMKPRRGATIRCGWTMGERRRVLADYCQVYISIEGGPNTAHEVALIQRRGATVLPVGRFGGCSDQLYWQMKCPVWAERSLWEQLMDNRDDVRDTAAAAAKLTELALDSIRARVREWLG